MKRSSRWALGCLFLLTAAAPTRADTPPPPDWSYSGPKSPEHWGEVAALCAKGQSQSPIGFNSRGAITRGPFPKLQIDWSPVTGEVVDNGHTLQLNVPPGNFLTYGDTRYALKQIQFHAPSEHNVNGEHTAMEMQFLHQTPEGKTLILGVLLTTGRTNAGLEPILSALPRPVGTPLAVKVNLPALLPSARTHFAYAGSVTRPPCTEGVQWLVIVAQPEVSKAQVDAFRARYPANARPTQAWHGRAISIAP